MCQDSGSLDGPELPSIIMPIVSDLDIYRSGVLVKQHGEDAPIHAAMRADALLEAGDLEGCAVFKRVRRRRSCSGRNQRRAKYLINVRIPRERFLQTVLREIAQTCYSAIDLTDCIVNDRNPHHFESVILCISNRRQSQPRSCRCSGDS